VLKNLSIDGTRAVVFCVVFIGVVALVATDKLPADYLKYLLAWLIPGPLAMDAAGSEEEKK